MMPTGLGGEVLWLCPSLDDSPDDLSGNGNNGTYVNGTATVADSDPTYGGSRAYNFDGTDDYINCGTAIQPNDLTMSVWIKATATPANDGIMGTGQSGGTSDEYMIYASTAARARLYGVGTHDPQPLTLNTWVHIAASRDTTSGNNSIYRNGVLVAQSAVAPNPSALVRDFVIGRYQGLFYFEGLLDDIRLYDRALTQAEITLLASVRGFTSGAGTHVQRTLLGVG